MEQETDERYSAKCAELVKGNTIETVRNITELPDISVAQFQTTINVIDTLDLSGFNSEVFLFEISDKYPHLILNNFSKLNDKFKNQKWISALFKEAFNTYASCGDIYLFHILNDAGNIQKINSSILKTLYENHKEAFNRVICDIFTNNKKAYNIIDFTLDFTFKMKFSGNMKLNLPDNDGNIYENITTKITKFNHETGEYTLFYKINNDSYEICTTLGVNDEIDDEELLDTVDANKYDGDGDLTDTVDSADADLSDTIDSALPHATLHQPRAVDFSGYIENTEKLRRKKKVNIIGDSHGNLDAFHKNLISLGLVDPFSKNWIGGDSDLVILGDIIADRVSEGLQILDEIDRLSIQSEETGGSITVIAGNHEDIMISFFLAEGITPYWDQGLNNLLTNCKYSYQGRGILELVIFADRNDNSSPYDLEQCMLDRDVILQNIRSSEIGQKLIKQMCNFDILAVKLNTLLVHTNMTEAMGQYILKYGIDNINTIFKSNLHNFLYNGETPDAQFREIRNVFLNALNRKAEQNTNPLITEDTLNKVKNKLGIHTIIHGHSKCSDPILNTFDTNIISCDTAFGKIKGFNRTNRSVAQVDENANVYSGRLNGEIIHISGESGDITRSKINLRPSPAFDGKVRLADGIIADIISYTPFISRYELRYTDKEGIIRFTEQNAEEIKKNNLRQFDGMISINGKNYAVISFNPVEDLYTLKSHNRETLQLTSDQIKSSGTKVPNKKPKRLKKQVPRKDAVLVSSPAPVVNRPSGPIPVTRPAPIVNIPVTSDHTKIMKIPNIDKYEIQTPQHFIFTGMVNVRRSDGSMAVGIINNYDKQSDIYTIINSGQNWKKEVLHIDLISENQPEFAGIVKMGRTLKGMVTTFDPNKKEYFVHMVDKDGNIRVDSSAIPFTTDLLRNLNTVKPNFWKRLFGLK